MVVQMLLAGGKRLPLDRLPDAVQLRLTRELAQLRIVDKGTVDAVATEFVDALESVGITAPGSVDAALAALEGQISEDAMTRLRNEVGRGPADDPWARVVKLPKPTLLKIAGNEAPEVTAVLLSKLPTAAAADLLGSMPGAQARRIALAVAQTGNVTPLTVARIGAALRDDYVADAAIAFATAPAPRVGAILNISRADAREEVLEGLGADDPDFAKEVRKAIFTFADIPIRVRAGDLPKVLRLVDNTDLVTAFAAADKMGQDEIAARDFILENMSKRLAESLREEMSELGAVKRAEGEAAMTQIISAIRDSADRGEITLVDPGDGAEDDD